MEFLDRPETPPLEGSKGLILARIFGSKDPSEYLTVTTQLYPWDKVPKFHYIHNDLAFNQNNMTLILLNNELYPLSVGMSYFLRHFRRETKGLDFLIFAPTLCLTREESEDDALFTKIRPQAHAGIDAMSSLNRLSDQLFKELRDPKHVPAERPPSERMNRDFQPYGRQCAWRLPAGASLPWSARHYWHLDRSLSEIRLLQVTLEGETPKFDLINRPLMGFSQESLSYNALSYCWGTGQAVVEVAGEPLTVSQSVYDFLEYYVQLMIHVRKNSGAPSPPQLIWIDAICINQQDQLEKVLQIKMMNMIYAKAGSVLVWLGHANEATAAALHDVSASEEKYKYQQRTNIVIEAERITQSPEEVKAIVSIFLRPYFTRAWPIQELVFAKPDNMWICMGGTMCIGRWPAIAGYSPLSTELEELAPIVSDLDATDEIKSCFMSGFIFARTQMIERIQARKAAVGKDKVYSLWSLADDADLCLVDYQLSDGQVFGDFTKAWIERYKRLDILSVRTVASGRRTTDCPAWAVDWADETRITKPLISKYPSVARDDSMDEVETVRLYNAAKNVPPVVNWVEAGGVRLLTAGISCDTVRTVGSMGRMPVKTELHKWQLFVKEHLLPANTHDLYNAIVVDRTPLGSRYGGKAQNIALFFNDLTPEESESVLSRLPDFNSVPELEQYRMIMRQHIFSVILGRRIAITEGGHIGLVPPSTEPGDEIAVIFGCSVPLVLRHQEDEPPMILGDCFFQRMMDGQMVDAVDEPVSSSISDITDSLSKFASHQGLPPDDESILSDPSGKSDPAPLERFSEAFKAGKQAREAEKNIYTRFYLF